MVSMSGSISNPFIEKSHSVVNSVSLTEVKSSPLSEDSCEKKEASATIEGEDSVKIKQSIFTAGDIDGNKRPELIEQKPNGKIIAYFFSKDLKNESQTVLLPGELGDSGLVLKGMYNSKSEKRIFLVFQHKEKGTVLRSEIKDNRLEDPELLDIDAKNWNIAALYDFPDLWNKNKNLTIVGQNKEGKLHRWVMNGVKAERDEDYSGESNMAPGWNIVGAGNFHTGENPFVHDYISDSYHNRVAHAQGCDLVSQYNDTLGTTAEKISLYDYGTLRGEKRIIQAGPYNEDRIVAVADMNGDRNGDIIRQKEDKSIVVTFMNETHQKYEKTLLEDWQMDEDEE